nr:hypothetical protein CFP56_32134 [Quercus suber]
MSAIMNMEIQPGELRCLEVVKEAEYQITTSRRTCTPTMAQNGNDHRDEVGSACACRALPCTWRTHEAPLRFNIQYSKVASTLQIGAHHGHDGIHAIDTARRFCLSSVSLAPGFR